MAIDLPAQALDVLMRFKLDRAQAQEVQRQLQQYGIQIDKVQEAADGSSQAVSKSMADATKALTGVSAQAKLAGKALTDMGGSVKSSGSVKALEDLQKRLMDLGRQAKSTQAQLIVATAFSPAASKTSASANPAVNQLAAQLKSIKTEMDSITDSVDKGINKAGVSVQDNLGNKSVNSAKQFKQALFEIENRFDAIARVGRTMEGFGMDITRPLQGLAQQYTSYVGNTTQVGREWIQTNFELQQSQMRIGEIAANEMLPYMKLAVDLTGKVADFLQAHPELIKIALAAGGTLAVAGQALSAAAQGSQIIRAIQDAQQGGLIGGGASAAGAGGAAAAGGAGAVTAGGTAVAGISISGGLAAAGIVALGVALDKFVTDRVNDASTMIGLTAKIKAEQDRVKAAGGTIYPGVSPGQNASNTTPILGQTLSILARGAGQFAEKFGASAGTANEWFSKMALATGALSGAAKDGAEKMLAAAETAHQANTMDKGEKDNPANKIRSQLIPEQALDSFIQFQQANTRAEDQFNLQKVQNKRSFEISQAQTEHQYQIQREQSLDQFNRQQLLTEKDHDLRLSRQRRDDSRQDAQRDLQRQQQQADSLRNFAYSEQRDEQQYYYQRIIKAAQFDREMAVMEAAHQLDLRRMTEDHNLRIFDLARSRDALGVATEMRDYEVKRRRSEEDYNIQVAQKNKDYAISLADEERQFQIQRDYRQQDFDRQVAEQNLQYEREKKVRDSDRALRDADQAADYALQQARSQEQFKISEELSQKQHDESLRVSQFNHDEQLRQMQFQFDNESRIRSNDFRDRIFQLNLQMAGESSTREQWYGVMTEKLKDWLSGAAALVGSNLPGQGATGNASATAYANSIGSSPGSVTNWFSGGGATPRRSAAGGYASYGNYLLGDSAAGGPGGTEFVLNSGTTRALEGAARGSLSQDRIMALASGRSGGRAGGGAVTFVDNRQFHGPMSAGDRAWIREASRISASEVLAATFREGGQV